MGENLPTKTVKIIEQAQSNSTVFMSDMSSWETSMLATKKRISISTDPLLWIKEAISKIGLQMLRLTPEVVVDSCRLPEWDPKHKDPADRIISSTARIHSMSLVTADKKLIKYAKTGNLHVESFRSTGDQ
jgi:PIN domain nuclease of toxin-antitoxin system